MQVFQGHVVITVMGEAENREDFDVYLGNADPATILSNMDDGDLIGKTHILASHEVPKGDLRGRLLEIGNDGTFFDGFPDDDDEPAPAVGSLGTEQPATAVERIERLMLSGQVSETGLRVALALFIEEAGLLDAFAAQLEQDLEIRKTATLELAAAAGIRASCEIRITDKEAFCETMGIADLEDLSIDALDRHMIQVDLDPETIGLASLGCDNLRVEGRLVTFDVVATLADPEAMTAHARTRYASCWGDADWTPSCPEEALWELALGSNGNPSPDVMGFEFLGGAPQAEPRPADSDDDPQP